MSIRVTFIMRWGRQAWSETHYDAGRSDLAGGISDAVIVAPKRAALLGFDAFLTAARVSDPNTPGLSELITFNPPLQGQKFTINVGFITSIISDSVGLANDAVLVDAGGLIGARFHRSRPMLGAPPAGLIQSAAGVPSVRVDECPQWLTAFNAYAAELTNGSWGFGATNEGAANDVADVIGGNGAPIGIVTSNAFSPAPQTIVHVRGLRVHPQTRVRLAGIWRVGSVVAGPGAGQNTVLLANSSTWPAGSLYHTPGTIQTASFAVAIYTRFLVGIGMTRKRGGTIGLPRGRSRTRA
jgi:hypothetical protein